jgi:hypothetical protein
VLTIPAENLPEHFCTALDLTRKKQFMYCIPMNTTNQSSNGFKPVRYITITGSTGKTCRKLKSLLKQTNYYCLVDCYKREKELINKEAFYLPDCVIMEIRTVYGLLFIHKKAARLKEALPGIKVILYYNMFKRYPLLEKKIRQYPEINSCDNEEKQLHSLEAVLQNNIQ